MMTLKVCLWIIVYVAVAIAMGFVPEVLSTIREKDANGERTGDFLVDKEITVSMFWAFCWAWPIMLTILTFVAMCYFPAKGVHKLYLTVLQPAASSVATFLTRKRVKPVSTEPELLPVATIKEYRS